MQVTRSTLATLAAITTGTAQQWHELMPQGRAGASAVFDLSRGRMILFGGESQITVIHNDTWEFDGCRWAPIPSINRPAGDSQLIYEPARARTLLFESGMARVWQLGPQGWTALPVTGGSRYRASVAHDVLRQRTILFGGRNAAGVESDETWEFDGLAWMRATPPAAPRPQMGASMVHDLARARIVLCGRGNAAVAETWEYDASNWVQVQTTTAPFVSWPGRLVYDTGNRRVLWCDGGEVMAYSGTDWTRIGTSQPPEAGHNGVALAHDPTRGVTLGFGGVEVFTAFLGTAEFNGSEWRDAYHLPAPRTAHAMVFDGRRVIGFGGMEYGLAALSSYVYRNDTFIRRDGTWATTPTSHAPAARAAHAMTFDPRRNRVVLHGGLTSPRVRMDDTWEFDGTDWGPVVTASRPPACAGHAMTYDVRRRQCVLFGDAAGTATWEFDGTNWQMRATTSRPPARTQHCLVHDPARERTVLFGGYGGTFLADTWEYDGIDWTRRNLAVAPPAGTGVRSCFDSARGVVRILSHVDWWNYDGTAWRQEPMLPPHPPANERPVYDPIADQIVLFGGAAIVSFPSRTELGRQETWIGIPAPVATWATLGHGCPGSGGTPSLATGNTNSPRLGSTFPLHVTSLPSAPGLVYLALGFGFASFAGPALPLDLAALGMPGCDLWIEPDFDIGTWLAHAGGSATVTLAIPAIPAFAGTRIAAQALVFDAATPGGATISNAGIAVVN